MHTAVALTDRGREQITAFIRSLYLAGVKDPEQFRQAPDLQGPAGAGPGA
jgi:hypothetical protein